MNRLWIGVILAAFGCGGDASSPPGAETPPRDDPEPLAQAVAPSVPVPPAPPCVIQPVVRPAAPALEVVIAPPEARLPAVVRARPAMWVALSFDTRDGVSGASFRSLRDYRPGDVRWDTDPPHVYLRGAGRPPVGPAPSLPRRFGSRERCAWLVRVEHEGSPVEICGHSDSGRHLVDACWGDTGARLFDGPDEVGLRSTAAWLEDWDDDGRLELLLEAQRDESAAPNYVGLFRLGAAHAELLGEHSDGLDNVVGR